MKWIPAFTAIAGMLLVLSFHAPPRAAATGTVSPGEPTRAASPGTEVSGEAILIFVPGVSPEMARSYVELLGYEVLGEFAELTASSEKAHLHVRSPNSDSEELARRFSEDVFVESATPNVTFKAK